MQIIRFECFFPAGSTSVPPRLTDLVKLAQECCYHSNLAVASHGVIVLSNIVISCPDKGESKMWPTFLSHSADPFIDFHIFRSFYFGRLVSRHSSVGAGHGSRCGVPADALQPGQQPQCSGCTQSKTHSQQLATHRLIDNQKFCASFVCFMNHRRPTVSTPDRPHLVGETLEKSTSSEPIGCGVPAGPAPLIL